MKHGFVEANGLRFHYVEAGSGPMVLMLHGFPEFWYGWRRQMPALAEAGFRVVAPDLRGYNETDRPREVRQYGLALLVDDVVALVAALGESKASIVGHDWGGVIAWYAAMRSPSPVGRLAILNAPHPAAYEREVRSLTSQVLRSTYALFFQLPLLPEALFRVGDFRLLRRVLAGGPASTAEEVDRYVQGFSTPGALAGPLNYYRAALRCRRPPCRRIAATPTLVLWGDRDPYLRHTLATGLNEWVDDICVQRFPDADHWLHHREVDRVNRALIDFLRG